MTNRLTPYFAQLDRRTPTYIDEQGAHYDDPLWLGQANCPVPTKHTHGYDCDCDACRNCETAIELPPGFVYVPIERIEFTELGGGCDDEHLKRVEPRKGDGESIVVCWPSFIFWTGYTGFVVAVIVWLVRLFG